MQTNKGFISSLVLLVIAVIALGAVNYVVFVKPASAPTIDEKSVEKKIPIASFGTDSLVFDTLTPTITGTCENIDRGVLFAIVKGNISLPKDKLPEHSVYMNATDHGGQLIVSCNKKSGTFSTGEYSPNLPPGTYTAGLYSFWNEYNDQGYQGPRDVSLHASATLTIAAPETKSPSEISVPGMSKYTDADFGFSFWYPSNWEITQSTKQPVLEDIDGGYYGDKFIKSLILSQGNQSFKIYEFTSKSGITSTEIKYYARHYFDAQKHLWMVESNWNPATSEYGGMYTFAADISNKTMGGLPMIDYHIVPLSASDFIVVELGGNNEAETLVSTIAATDPSVATPVSASEQIKTIQAEKDAYSEQ